MIAGCALDWGSREECELAIRALAEEGKKDEGVKGRETNANEGVSAIIAAECLWYAWMGGR